MARIRTIKPGFFTSLTISELPKPTRLTFIGLWTYVDDAGRGVDDARLVKAELWPLDDDYPTRKVDADLDLLHERGLIIRYTAGHRRYFQVKSWDEHQRINRPQPSKLPAPDGTITEHSLNDHGMISDGARQEGKGREGKGSVNALTRFDEFWSAYPKRQDRGHAETAWKNATKDTDPDVIISGAHRYANDPGRKPDFTKNGATWLRGRCWLDEPLRAVSGDPMSAREF